MSSQLWGVHLNFPASVVVTLTVSVGKGLICCLHFDDDILNVILLAEDHSPFFLRGVSEGLDPLQPYTAFLLYSED